MLQLEKCILFLTRLKDTRPERPLSWPSLVEPALPTFACALLYTHYPQLANLTAPRRGVLSQRTAFARLRSSTSLRAR